MCLCVCVCVCVRCETVHEGGCDAIASLDLLSFVSKQFYTNSFFCSHIIGSTEKCYRIFTNSVCFKMELSSYLVFFLFTNKLYNFNINSPQHTKFLNPTKDLTIA